MIDQNKKIRNFLTLKPSRHFFVWIFIFIITIALFMPALKNDFIRYDDPLYVLENETVKKGLTLEGLTWAFTNLSAGFWFPITWISHMMDCQFFNLSPSGHHFTSLLFHAINSAMLFSFFFNSTGVIWRSFFIALIFAIHPMHVEPVAWISSRKDVLSTFFWITTMCFYANYVQRKNAVSYCLVLISFGLGLMAKSMLVTLPFILLLLDFWPFDRLKDNQKVGSDFNLKAQQTSIRKKVNLLSHLILEKVPLILLTGIFIIVTFIAENNIGAVSPSSLYSLSVRTGNAFVSYINYIIKTFVPFNLSVYYPHTGMPDLWKVFSAFFLLAAVSIFSLTRGKQYKYFTVGWFWYLASLFPVIGFIQLGTHSMADRYSYVPLIGIYIMMSWGFPEIIRSFGIKRVILYSITGVYIISLAYLTKRQISYWQNDVTLFNHAVNIDKENYLAHYNLGLALAKRSREEEALPHMLEALKLERMRHEIYYNIGNLMQSLHRNTEAISYYKKSITLDPDYEMAHLNLGNAYYNMKDYPSAIKHYKETLRIVPDNDMAHNNLGVIFALKGKKNEAVSEFNAAIKINPDSISAQRNLNSVLKNN